MKRLAARALSGHDTPPWWYLVRVSGEVTAACPTLDRARRFRESTRRALRRDGFHERVTVSAVRSDWWDGPRSEIAEERAGSGGVA